MAKAKAADKKQVKTIGVLTSGGSGGGGARGGAHGDCERVEGKGHPQGLYRFTRGRYSGHERAQRG